MEQKTQGELLQRIKILKAKVRMLQRTVAKLRQQVEELKRQQKPWWRRWLG